MRLNICVDFVILLLFYYVSSFLFQFFLFKNNTYCTVLLPCTGWCNFLKIIFCKIV